MEGWKKNVDAIMYDLGDCYYIETITDKGCAALDPAPSTEPTAADTSKKNEAWERFKSTSALPFAGKVLYDNLAWDDPIWAEISEKCIACGMCSFMCPSWQLFRHPG